jgi:PAS domain S-box-containing protein
VQVDDRAERPDIKRAPVSRGVVLLIILIVSLLSADCPASTPPKRVLILHAYNYTFPATTLASDAARRRLLERSPPKIEVEADFLDLARRPDEAAALRTATFLGEKYAGVHIDAVLVIGVPAVPFIVKYRDVIAPGVPVVFAGGSRSNYASLRMPPDMTGVLTELDLERTLALAEQLQPNARRLFVVAGSSRDDDQAWYAAARRVIEGRSRNFETTYLYDLRYEAVVAELSHAPRDSIVVLLTFLTDGSGKSFVPRDVARDFASASAAPAYSPYDTFIGSGIVGGYVKTYEALGTTAADMVLEILAGKDPRTMPPRDNTDGAYRVDAKAMDRFGLKQGLLPPGSTVLFGEPTLWDQHRTLISATALVLGLQSLGLAALLFQRHRRRQAESSLEQSEDRMTFAAASANVGLWQFDRTSNELWATEHSRVMFGLAKDLPLTRETFLAAVHSDDRLVAVSALRGVVKNQSAVADVRVVLADGQIRWIRVRVRSHLDDHGSPDQLSGIFVDITERKTAEIEADVQRQQVTHLTRVLALGELSGAIAHEVNQPLTAILSNAQAALYLLSQDSPNLADIRDALQDIVQEDNRAGAVIHRLRDLLKNNETRSEQVDVNEMVDSTNALLRSELIGRQITVETDLASGLPPVFGDPVQLQQVLLNLIMNAMDATASMPASRRRIKISSRLTPTDTIEVLVKDHGTGINPADGSRPFEPFYTTKDHGLGLGLSICSTIVGKHGGTITLGNDDAGGAVARVSLPVHKMLMAAQ